MSLLLASQRAGAFVNITRSSIWFMAIARLVSENIYITLYTIEGLRIQQYSKTSSSDMQHVLYFYSLRDHTTVWILLFLVLSQVRQLSLSFLTYHLAPHLTSKSWGDCLQSDHLEMLLTSSDACPHGIIYMKTIESLR